MGKRKVRKRDRRREQRARKQGGELRDADDLWTAVDSEMAWSILERENFSAVTTTEAATCGHCREFVSDPEGGRGDCSHPASGVVSPWSDTPACPYYRGRNGYRG